MVDLKRFFMPSTVFRCKMSLKCPYIMIFKLPVKFILQIHIKFSTSIGGLEVESSLRMREVPGSIPRRGNSGNSFKNLKNIFLLVRTVKSLSFLGSGKPCNRATARRQREVFQGPVEKAYPAISGLFQPFPVFSTRLWKTNCYIRGQRFGFHKQGKAIRKRLNLIDKFLVLCGKGPMSIQHRYDEVWPLPTQN